MEWHTTDVEPAQGQKVLGIINSKAGRNDLYLLEYWKPEKGVHESDFEEYYIVGDPDEKTIDPILWIELPPIPWDLVASLS